RMAAHDRGRRGARSARRRLTPHRRLAGEDEQLEDGGAEDQGQQDGQDEGGAGSHEGLLGVRVTGWGAGRSSSSPGATSVTSVPAASPRWAAAERRSMQTASMP